MEVGESQDWSWAASGWARRSLFVCFFIRFQGIIEYQLEVGRRGGHRVSTGHESGSGGFVEKAMDCVVGDRVKG